MNLGRYDHAQRQGAWLWWRVHVTFEEFNIQCLHFPSCTNSQPRNCLAAMTKQISHHEPFMSTIPLECGNVCFSLLIVRHLIIYLHDI
jgi:hypothetical protein